MHVSKVHMKSPKFIIMFMHLAYLQITVFKFVSFHTVSVSVAGVFTFLTLSFYYRASSPIETFSGWNQDLFNLSSGEK